MTKSLEYIQSYIGKGPDERSTLFARWLDGKLISAESGAITAELIVRKDWLNPAQTLHGGAMLAMMDEMIGMTALSLTDDGFYVTLSMNTDFFNSAFEGDTVRVVTTTTRRGVQVVNIQCDVRYEPRKRLLARANAVMMFTRRKATSY